MKGSDSVPVELIDSGGNALHSESYELVNSIWNKEELTTIVQVSCYCICV
jgi:hypothetical protein